MFISKKFKTMLSKNNNKMEEVPGDILKHVLGNKSLQHHIFVAYDFKTMVVENKSKLEEFKKNKDELCTIKMAKIARQGLIEYLLFRKYYMQQK